MAGVVRDRPQDLLVDLTHELRAPGAQHRARADGVVDRERVSALELGQDVLARRVAMGAREPPDRAVALQEVGGAPLRLRAHGHAHDAREVLLPVQRAGEDLPHLGEIRGLALRPLGALARGPLGLQERRTLGDLGDDGTHAHDLARRALADGVPAAHPGLQDAAAPRRLAGDLHAGDRPSRLEDGAQGVLDDRRHARGDLADRAPDVLLDGDAVEARELAVHPDEAQVGTVERETDGRGLEDRVQERERLVAQALGCAHRAEVLEHDDAEPTAAAVGDDLTRDEEREEPVRAAATPAARRAAPRRARCACWAGRRSRAAARPHRGRAAGHALLDRPAREAAARQLVRGAVGERDQPRPGLDEHDGRRQLLEDRLEELAGDRPLRRTEGLARVHAGHVAEPSQTRRA